MALEAQILVNNYGLPSEFAHKLLAFTQGDVEGAIRILEFSEKDVIAVKVKFLSSKKLSYGAIILFFNFQTNMPEYALCTLSSDANLSKIKIEGDWREFLDEMMTFLRGDEADFDNSARLEQELLSSNNIPYITSFFADKGNMDLVNLKRFMINSLSKVLLDNSIVLKMVATNIDVFKFKNILSVLKTGLKILPKKGMDIVMLIKMNIEPVLAPIGGVDIEKISAGNEILVKITDDREIVKYIGTLIGFTDSIGINQPTYGKVVQNIRSAESGNNLVMLEFGPGIYGTFVMGGKVRVQMKTGDSHEGTKAGGGATSLDKNTMDTIKNISNFDNVRFDATSLKSSPQWDSDISPDKKMEPVKKSPMTVVNIIIIALVVIFVIVLLIIGLT